MTPAATATTTAAWWLLAVEPGYRSGGHARAVDVAGQPPGEASECSDYPCNDDVDGWEARVQIAGGLRGELLLRASTASRTC